MNKKLAVLMVTAFVDMMGGAIVFPQIPFFAERVIGHGPLWTALELRGAGRKGLRGRSADHDVRHRAARERAILGTQSRTRSGGVPR